MTMAMVTTTTIPTAMTTDTRPATTTLVRLMWLASPALPVGGFSYSDGLEAAVDAGLVHDEASATDWLLDQLHLVLVRAEMPVLHHAWQAWMAPADAALEPGIEHCNTWVLETRESFELRLQCEQMGRSLAQWLAQRLPPEDPRLLRLQQLPGGPTWPVAFALACADAGATARETLLALAFAWAENQVQAAIKCVPLGQSAGQRILARLTAEFDAAVQAALGIEPQDRQAFAPGLAIFSARHEQQYSRLFRS